MLFSDAKYTILKLRISIFSDKYKFVGNNMQGIYKRISNFEEFQLQNKLHLLWTNEI